MLTVERNDAARRVEGAAVLHEGRLSPLELVGNAHAVDLGEQA